jgi:hypothetical protein
MCRDCKTELEKRRIPFGRVGYVEIICCECEAMRLTLKYSNTGPADNKREIFMEDL